MTNYISFGKPKTSDPKVIRKSPKFKFHAGEILNCHAERTIFQTVYVMIIKMSILVNYFGEKPVHLCWC